MIPHGPRYNFIPEQGSAYILLPPWQFALTEAGEAAVSLSLVKLKTTLQLLEEWGACHVSSRNLTGQVFDLHHCCPAKQGAYSFIPQEQIALVKEGGKYNPVRQPKEGWWNLFFASPWKKVHLHSSSWGSNWTAASLELNYHQVFWSRVRNWDPELSLGPADLAARGLCLTYQIQSAV